MRYRLTTHARDQMIERGVSASELDAVVQSPEQIVPGKRGKNIYQSRIRGGYLLLRLVMSDNSDPGVIITIYLTSQVSRYWREEP